MINETEFPSWIPMCCFCDIPLSQISEHLREYGRYGVGMSRNWALKLKLNPVHYVQSKSSYLECYDKLMNLLYDDALGILNNKLSIKTVLDAFDYGISLIHYLKPYEGINRKTGKKKCFYDEREWRYVPEEFLKNNYGIFKEEFFKGEAGQQKNQELSKYPLVFNPSDINYIVIERENDRADMIRTIRQIKEPKFTRDIIDILVSKLISAELIEKDM